MLTDTENPVLRVQPASVPDERRFQGGLPPEAWFQMGPDQHGIRRSRPYFLVPLFGTKFGQKFGTAGSQSGQTPNQTTVSEATGTPYLAARQEVKQRISGYIQAQSQFPPSTGQGPITDVFILSHGWHRNFYAGIAAYDRLYSRLALLIGDGRIPLPAKMPFSPLFITLHWHSDPGADTWVDKSGRRHKASFMQAAADLFTLEDSAAKQYKAELAAMSAAPAGKFAGYAPKELDFVRDFEQIFQYFSELSAPDRFHTWDAQTTQDPDYLTKMAEDLYRVLGYYTLKEECRALPEDKVVVAWRCYHEADSRGIQVDAETPSPAGPARSLKGWESFVSVIRFATAVLGPLALLGGIGRPITTWILEHKLQSAAVFLILIGVSAWVLEANVQRRRNWKLAHQYDKPQSGMPIARLLAYAVLQIACILPLVLRCLVGYVMSAFLGQYVFPLYDERTENYTLPWSVKFARYPVRQLQQAVGPDSSVLTLVEGLDSQVAFWEMQHKGVWAGHQAAAFLNELMEENPTLFPADGNGARIHTIGHSFGALVVLNLARKLTELRKGRNTHIKSLCLLEGAVASGWFDAEPQLVDSITNQNRGVITSIFSRYDTANGYIYPLVNQARMALGSVGMARIGTAKKGAAGQNSIAASNTIAAPNSIATQNTNVGVNTAAVQNSIAGASGYNLPPEWPVWRNGFASLVTPPDLDVTAPCMLNIDASRLIYFGAPALGGGHDDIFKDDVLHLLWAVSHVPARLQYAAQPQVEG